MEKAKPKLTEEEEQFLLFLKEWHRVSPFKGPVFPADVALCEREERANVIALHSGKE